MVVAGRMQETWEARVLGVWEDLGVGVPWEEGPALGIGIVGERIVGEGGEMTGVPRGVAGKGGPDLAKEAAAVSVPLMALVIITVIKVVVNMDNRTISPVEVVFLAFSVWVPWVATRVKVVQEEPLTGRKMLLINSRICSPIDPQIKVALVIGAPCHSQGECGHMRPHNKPMACLW